MATPLIASTRWSPSGLSSTSTPTAEPELMPLHKIHGNQAARHVGFTIAWRPVGAEEDYGFLTKDTLKIRIHWQG
jgi:hypothetical protein